MTGMRCIGGAALGGGCQAGAPAVVRIGGGPGGRAATGGGACTGAAAMTGGCGRGGGGAGIGAAIGAVAAATSQIKLGTGVACLPNHEPSMLAHRIAFLDHLAQGRFLFGIGSGGFPGDFEMYEVDYQAGEQRELTREAIDTILRLWTEPQPGIYEGKRFRFRVPETDSHPGVKLHMKPFQRPHPPIAVAGVSKGSETLRLAGERGWIPMSINFVPDTMLKVICDLDTVEQWRV